MFIPLRVKSSPGISPLKSMEHDLHSVVAFFALPVFALANAGINFSGVSGDRLLHDVPIGIAMGLFIGSLAFEETGVNLLFDERLGIILGSVISGFPGYAILRSSLRPRPVV